MSVPTPTIGRPRLRRSLLALCLGGALLPVGTAAQDPSPATTDLRPLSVGLGYIPSVQFAPFYLARSSGMYADAGLDVTLQNQIDPDLITLIAQGAVDIGLGDGTSVITARSQGIPIRYVAGIYADFPSVVVADAASGITTPADLAGKRLGTPGRYGSGWIMLQALLSSADLTTQDLDISLYPDFGQAAGLVQGQVDAITGFVNNEPIAVARQGITPTVLTVDDVVPLPGNGLVTGETTLAGRRDDLASFVAVTLAAMDAITADPQLGLDAAFEAVPELAADPDLQREILDATIDAWHDDLTDAQGLGAIDPADWTASIGFMSGMPDSPVAAPVTAEQIVTTELLPGIRGLASAVTHVRAMAALACALAVALSTTLPAGVLATAQVPTAPQARIGEPPPVPRPDIIVVYVDDVPPLDGRFWDAERTPAIRRWIVDRGLTFRNAIGESPLCCPARANLLTGLHTHNNGVTRNDAALLDPRVTVASELHDMGYRTAWIGKYLNRYMSLRGSARLAHEVAWDTFLPMSGGGHGYYYWPKGERRYSRPAVHSMQLLQQQAVRELRAAPRDRPLFAVLSTYAGHRPNEPLPEFRGSARCAGIGRWKPPNYGSTAGAGKPDWMRRWAARQRQQVSSHGASLVRVCEDMLGVEQLVGLVAREQMARGRLDDTLLVLTSDNGLLLGEYGLVGKQVPWSVPVPLTMAWPRAMGTTARTTDAPTSNIDLAPTFCALAGCRMGPYPTGQASADGISLVPLMLGGQAPARTALLSVMLDGNHITGMPSWTAVTTYPGDPLGRWHYIRWQTGRRELYDLAADPWEVHDVAQLPAYAAVRHALEMRRRELLAEGTGQASGTGHARAAKDVR